MNEWLIEVCMNFYLHSSYTNERRGGVRYRDMFAFAAYAIYTTKSQYVISSCNE
jgi:hypothetical protein